MKVVLINETYSPLMGYLGTMLPKYLARLGMEVHVIATALPAYHNFNEHASGNPEFLEQQALPGGTVQQRDGYTVHILEHSRLFGHVYFKGLVKKLSQLSPDIVYSVLALGWIPLQTAGISLFSRFRFFIGSHTSALMFPLARAARPGYAALAKTFLSRWVPGRIVSLTSRKCYCPTDDCGEVASRFFGIQKTKVKIVHLGFDTDVFFPVVTAADLKSRADLRADLGFAEDEIVCIYTGKMAALKNPLLLADAITLLRAEGLKFRGLFIGEGGQRDLVAANSSCTVLPFMPFTQLGNYYRASDIAVWPTNESTSMLDAAACGLPIIVSDRIYQDHVSGNGRSYKINDLASLCGTLRELSDPQLRHELGAAGARKMSSRFTWEIAARIRRDDFLAAL